MTNILSYRHWQVGVDRADSEAYRVADGRAQGKALVAKLDGLDDRDQAQALANQTIWVRRSELPDCEPGEYYWTDLEGLGVETVDGRILGTVNYLIETGANDVLVVKGDREVLIPFIVGDVIKSVDVEDGKIVVNWDDSYLD